ncbi:unnamed protein product [Linum tenue]|uniref:Uncharacterized protein n=1 Tax=Linum tenue TaxID=586396 RepID=A0AAV0LLN3_9ROSI|nr:unnamed protein product [Linum tenue]
MHQHHRLLVTLPRLRHREFDHAFSFLLLPAQRRRQGNTTVPLHFDQRRRPVVSDHQPDSGSCPAWRL